MSEKCILEQLNTSLEENNSKILLLGGAGFLGSGLQEELRHRNNVCFKSVDKEEIDLFDAMCILKLVAMLKDFDNVVLLASKLGAKLFETSPLDASNYNKTIHQNVLEAIKLASMKHDKTYSVTYYSTSEVFGSLPNINAFITENTDYRFDFSNPRHLYALVKWQAERDYFLLHSLHPEMISSVKILRPFNVYGKNLQRGVLFDMIQTALTLNKIYYADDTTRTMTSVDYASKLAVDAIIQDVDVKLNLADDKCSLTMKSLAEIVNDVLDLDCEFVKMPADKSIRYRTTSKVDADIDLTRKMMTKHIIELADKISAKI